MAGKASIPISVTTARSGQVAGGQLDTEKQAVDYVGPFDHIAHE
jgi:hypothetical protein